MREISLPLPHLEADETTEITVSLKKKNIAYQFRIEAFNWSNAQSLQQDKIETLRKAIECYDQDYEIIQIFTPAEDAEYIQVLFRQKINM